MVIAVDIDEILFPLKKYFYEYLSKKFSKPFDNNSPHYEIGTDYGMSYKDATHEYYRFMETKTFSTMKPLEGAVEGMKELKKLSDVWAVTSRQDFAENSTLKNLNLYFQNIFSGLKMGNHHNLYDSNNEKSKRELCNEIGARVLIEDQIKYAEDLHKTIPVILFNKPWNQDYEKENVYRAESWKEIVKITKTILIDRI